MNQPPSQRCIAFEGTRCIGRGSAAEVAPRVKAVVDRGDHGPVLIFDAVTSQPIEWDLRGAPEEVAARFTEPAAVATADRAAADGGDGENRRGPGRPKLGVVSREVTLLPRHWDWLAQQPGSASVTLRKLVERARQESAGRDRARRAQESAYRFLTSIAGNLPLFEDATRALFAGDAAAFAQRISGWPTDIRDHARRLADKAFEAMR